MTGRIRIVVPTGGAGGIDSPRSAHFGRADSFTLVDVVDGTVTSAGAIMNPTRDQGGCAATVAALADIGVGVAIVVGMGGGPQAAMASRGLRAYFDGESATPRQAVDAYLDGSLTPFGADHGCVGH